MLGMTTYPLRETHLPPLMNFVSKSTQVYQSSKITSWETMPGKVKYANFTLRLISIILVLTLPLLGGCRVTHKTFKGMELYSWQDENEVWQFSVLPGTNRNKTISEVKESQITAKEVGAKFCQMAKDEQVFWIYKAQDLLTGELRTFPLPSEDIIAEISAQAANCEIELINLFQ